MMKANYDSLMFNRTEFEDIAKYKDDKQLGTVIVSLDHMPSIENTEDVKTINRINLRLRDADLLPIRSYL